MGGEEGALRSQFFNDAMDLLGEAEELVLHLENHGYDEDSLHTLFRLFHTLKGNSNMVGESEINLLTHSLESQLDKVRKGKEDLSGELIQATLEAIDLLSNVCQAEDSAGYATALREMTANLSGGEAESGQGSPAASPSDVSVRAGSSAESKPARGAVAPSPASITLDDEPQSGTGPDFERWRPLLLRFYRVKELSERLAREEEEDLLMELGMESIELRSEAGEYGASVERLCAYTEKFTATLSREQIPYNRISYELLYLLLGDLEGLLIRRLQEAGAIREFVITSLEELREVSRALEHSTALNVIEIALPEDNLFREKDGLELFSELDRAAPGRVICVNAGSGVYKKATALLDEMLDGFVRIANSVEEGLYQLMRAEDTE